tara:strand:+ start:6377 stop:7378 length:1002 start_codon:yes stop_codon:yes gene_type:complete
MKKKISLNDRIFIAGATGMAGNAIYRRLKIHGYGSKKNNGKLLIPNRREVNLSDSNEVINWFRKERPSVVIIAAAKVGGILANSKYPADFLLENLKIQNNIIENSFNFGVKRLLFLGSSCIYPKFCSQPIHEEFLLDGKLESTNEPYAIAKISGIKLCQSLRKQYEFDAISLMPTNLYGQRDNYQDEDSHVMAALIKRFYIAKLKKEKSVTCWGTGSPQREFMHVDDLAEAVVFALEKWDPSKNDAPKDDIGNPLTYLNVGTGNEISIMKLSEKIATILNYEGKIFWDHTKPDGTPRKLLNIDKIKQLGWEPKINLDKGIADTIESFKKEYFN